MILSNVIKALPNGGVHCDAVLERDTCLYVEVTSLEVRTRAARCIVGVGLRRDIVAMASQAFWFFLRFLYTNSTQRS